MVHWIMGFDLGKAYAVLGDETNRNSDAMHCVIGLVFPLLFVTRYNFGKSLVVF